MPLGCFGMVANSLTEGVGPPPLMYLESLEVRQKCW